MVASFLKVGERGRESESKETEGEIGGEERGVICECRANSKT